jgi:hypothetical protein
MDSDMRYNGYPIYFRPTVTPSEYYAILNNGTEVARVDLAELFEIIKKDLKKG